MPSLANCPRFNKYWSRQDLVEQDQLSFAKEAQRTTAFRTMPIYMEEGEMALAIHTTKTICATLIVIGEIKPQ